jgi:transposase
VILDGVADALLSLLFPHWSDVRVHGVSATSASLRFDVAATSRTAVCPVCGRSSGRVHSRYERQLADQALGGRAVSIRLRARRFRCINPECVRSIFAEQIPGLAERYQRRSALLTTLLTKIGLALGGRPGQRMTQALAAEVSRSTLLRLVRSLPVPKPGVLRVIGVDDFALRRGHVYGSVLINMEDHRPVDLLGDRDADTLAGWLRRHPHIQVVCRDRGGPYAEGARRGAPDAIQVADRWHLLHNLTKAVDRVVRSHRKCLQHSDTAEQTPSNPPRALVQEPTPGLREHATRERHAEVHALLDDGLGIKTISRRLNLARETVRRYARAAQPDHLLSERGRTGSDLDEHVPYLTKRWEEGCTNAVRLHEEVRARGYRGAVRTVRALVQDWRITSPPRATTIKTPPKTRDVTAWIMRPAAKVSDEQKAELQQVLDRCDTLRQVDRLVSDFAGMAREREGRHLDTWIARARASGMSPIVGFAEGLIKDYDAVRNGLSLEWSSGTVEGHVNRIKTIKRTMYGRANFDLLRQRVLLGG